MHLRVITRTQKIHRVFYIFAGIVRVLSVIAIIKWPLGGWLLIFFVDTVDYFFALRGGLTFAQYQSIDKSLDILNRFYFVVPALVFNWPVRDLFIILFFYRLVGDFMYFKNKAEKYFFLFPNVLEFLLPAYIIFNHNLLLSLAIAVPLKLAHEYGLHIKNFIDPTSRNYISNHPEHERTTGDKKERSELTQMLCPPTPLSN